MGILEIIGLAGLALLLVLQAMLWVRKPQVEMPPDWGLRLSTLEQQGQALTLASARTEAASGRLEQQLITFSDRMAHSFEGSRKALDEQLSKTVEESRSGRKELMLALTDFEAKLQQRLGAVDATLDGRLTGLQIKPQEGLEANRLALDEQLSKTVEESRSGRKELMLALTDFEAKLQQRLGAVDATLDGRLTGLQIKTQEGLDANRLALDLKMGQSLTDAREGRMELAAAFQTFEGKLEERLSGFDTAMNGRFMALQQALQGRLDESGKAQLAQLQQAQQEALNNRKELTDTLGQFRVEVTATLKQLSQDTHASRQVLAQNATAFEQQIQTRFEALQATVSQQLQHMAQGSQHNAEQLRAVLNERLAAIQADNTAKLEEMRRTVDEKLHATLEQRLGDSFKLVSERLEQVHAGLGEMKSLAGSVGDLKRVMTNVRTRGTWGEVQLGAIIENLLTVEQYAQNVKTVPGSNDLVEYAVRMPGKTDEQVVWLPIDSKYPVEHYQRLMDAHESADKALIQPAATAFEGSLRVEAKKIATKYLSPPHTTDFAILFVPTEGLFAEVCRIPGMVEALQNDFRVVVAGPTTLSAILNSLRLGFRTLAIEQRSSEVWSILSAVKTEFRKFGDIVEATQKSIDTAAKKFGDIGVRSRAIERQLRGVEALPQAQADGLLLASAPEAPSDD